MITPDTAVDDQVTELGEQRYEQFLEQIDLADVPVAIEQQLAVGAQ